METGQTETGSEWARIRDMITRHPDWMERPRHREMIIRMMKRVQAEHDRRPMAVEEPLPF